MAFALAALIGLAVFGIWWFTSPAPRGEPSGSSAAAPSFAPGGATEGKPDAPSEPVDVPGLPRGGTLTGSADDMEAAVRWLTQAPLVRINRSSDALEPWLAESWTASAGNLIYTVKLRPAIVWSDGTPLTAEDAVASIATVTVMGKPLAARAIDPQTIEITFPAPFAPGLRVLDAHPVLPRHAPPERVGLGPFVREKGAFVRNPHYWRKAADGEPLPYLSALNLSASAASLLRRDGEAAADFADRAIFADDYEALKKLEQDGKARLFHLGPGLDVDALMFAEVDPRQSDKPWLHSDTFRLAISTAVDRREYCKQVFFGACDAIAGPVSPANAAWFNPDLPLGPGNPLVARAMLGDLGLRDRSGDGMLDDAARRLVRFSMLIRRDVPSAARAATFLKETLKLVGVDVAVTPVDGATLRARQVKGNYEAIYDRVEVRDTDPAMNLDFWLTPGAAADWQRQINALMMKNASSFDRIERLQAFAEVQRIYNRHMPAVFFGAPHVRVFTSARVLNATPSPLRPHLLWNAENLAALK